MNTDVSMAAEPASTYAVKPEIIYQARIARRVVAVAAAILAGAFAWLQFREIDFTPITNDISAKYLLRLTLALYYTCWVAGLLSDTNDQEVIYFEPPSKKRL